MALGDIEIAVPSVRVAFGEWAGKWCSQHLGANPPLSRRVARARQDPEHEAWRITAADGSVDLTFTPWGVRAAREDFKVVVSDFIQPYGTFAGTLRFRDGDTTVQIELDGDVGVVENHFAKW